ncbi:hypothetical protein BGX28_007663 [Mortierella sp. GBA30]|nr:hypothetical protein BGX28_007663 [Mortierella sp. GBA30]
MSSYSTYSSHHKENAGRQNHNSTTCSPSPPIPLQHSSSTHPNKSQIYSVENSPNTKTTSPIGVTSGVPALGAGTNSSSLSVSSKGASPTSTLQGSTSYPARGGSPTVAFSNVSLAEPTRWKRFRLKVMRMATVERLQLLWGLLALFGTMSWLALMPAYAFSQRALLPRIINHPSTQTATIIISVILTILNFLSWMILAADNSNERGARTDCTTGRLSTLPGFTAQCRGVNTAIVLDVVVFILWIPISVVIVCGTIDRGLWWWGEDDGWAQGEAIVGGSNIMSEEEFDRKIGMGSKQIKRRQTVHPENLSHQQQQDMVMIQQPKPAFVTPIASQFRSSTSLGMAGGGGGADDGETGDDDDYNFTPSSYRRHHQQRQRQQEARRLNRRGSNTSLSSRLSTFFGAGWGNGSMPPPEAAQPPMPEMPSQYRQENSNMSSTALARQNNNNKNSGENRERKTSSSSKKAEGSKQEMEEDPEPLHGDAYTSQWHSRWS